MSASKDFVVTFHATSAAMSAEKHSQAADMQAELKPVPRELSSSCGLALEVKEIELEKLKELLDSQGIDVEALYRDGSGGYEPVE